MLVLDSWGGVSTVDAFSRLVTEREKKTGNKSEVRVTAGAIAVRLAAIANSAEATFARFTLDSLSPHV